MITKTALLCLALNAYHEARGEGPEGIHAVTHVVQNRVNSPRWPEDHCSVVFQDHQFSWVGEELPVDVSVFLDVYEHVVDAVMLPDSTGGATHYHADYVSPRWASLYPETAVVGAHIFYKAPKGL